MKELGTRLPYTLPFHFSAADEGRWSLSSRQGRKLGKVWGRGSVVLPRAKGGLTKRPILLDGIIPVLGFFSGTWQ